MCCCSLWFSFFSFSPLWRYITTTIQSPHFGFVKKRDVLTKFPSKVVVVVVYKKFYHINHHIASSTTIHRLPPFHYVGRSPKLLLLTARPKLQIHFPFHGHLNWLMKCPCVLVLPLCSTQPPPVENWNANPIETMRGIWKFLTKVLSK